MKRNRFLSILMLLSLTFSIVHEFAIVFYENAHSHCDVTHYVEEFSQPLPKRTNHETLCANHYIFHIAYIITKRLRLQMDKSVYTTPKREPLFSPPYS